MLMNVLTLLAMSLSEWSVYSELNIIMGFIIIKAS
jgi:hypothetical protein